VIFVHGGTMLELIRSPEILIFFISSFLFSFAWSIRLEAKVYFQGKLIEALEKQVQDGASKHDALDKLMTIQLTEVKVLLGEIKGFLFRNEGNKI
jgi:hypothetical protein